MIAEEKDFEDLCNAMSDNGVQEVKQASVFEFYSKVQYLEKKIQGLKSVAGKV